MLADDMVILVSGDELLNVIEVLNAKIRFLEWLYIKKLKLNVNKAKYICLPSEHKTNTIEIYTLIY